MEKVGFRLNFFISLFALAVILTVNIFLLSPKGSDQDYYWVFEAMHFISGFFVALLMSVFFRSNIAIFILVGAVGVLWEFWEFSVINFPSISQTTAWIFSIRNLYNSWQDTVLDMILNFTGALLFIFWPQNKKR